MTEGNFVWVWGVSESPIFCLQCLNLAENKLQDNMTVQWEANLYIQYSKESIHYEPYDQAILLEQSAVA